MGIIDRSILNPILERLAAKARNYALEDAARVARLNGAGDEIVSSILSLKRKVESEST